MSYKEQIYKQAKAKSEFQKLKDKKIKLTPEERKKCLDEKAVWHFSPKNVATPAVWKSQDKDGKVTYVTNTHRAYNTAPTLKGAISRFHNFIKSTASEESEEMEKQALLGIPGAITGMILGGAAGAKTGNVLAGLKYKPTHSQQKLLAERNVSQENLTKVMNDYNAKKDSLLIDWDTYDDLVNEVNSPDFDDLTVSEVEDYAKNKYFSLNKSASFKDNLLEFGREEGKRFLTGAGIGSVLMGSALGSSTYKDRKRELTDSSYMKNVINQDRDAVINYTNKLKSLNPNSDDAYYSAIGDFDHNSVYSPSLLAKDKFDVACEGSAYYGEALNEKLKEEGVDYKALPWKQYKNLLALNADSIGEDDGTHSWELKTASIDTYKEQIYKTAAESNAKNEELVLESREYTITGKRYQLNKLEEAFKLMQYLGRIGATRNVRVMIDGDGSAQFKFKDLESSKEEKDKFHEFTNTGKPDFDVSIE